MNEPTRLAEYVEHFRTRAMQEALQTATAEFWRKRAEDFRAVGTPQCDEIAEACENRARVSLLGGDIEEFYAALEAGEAS